MNATTGSPEDPTTDRTRVCLTAIPDHGYKVAIWYPSPEFKDGRDVVGFIIPEHATTIDGALELLLDHRDRIGIPTFRFGPSKPVVHRNEGEEITLYRCLRRGERSQFRRAVLNRCPEWAPTKQ